MDLSAPFPTDYGPDTATEFQKILRLPPEQRPCASDIRRLLGRTPRPPRPDVPFVDEWMRIPPTTPQSYLCNGSALTIPDPRHGGDWHDGWHYRRRIDDPPKTAQRSSDFAHNAVLTHVLNNVLGTERVIDARAGLALTGHPDAQGEGPPIWAASHERSTVESVLRSTIGRHTPASPDTPEFILDRRTVYRWISTPDQYEWVENTLEAIARNLPPDRAAAIRSWNRNVFHNDTPTE